MRRIQELEKQIVSKIQIPDRRKTTMGCVGVTLLALLSFVGIEQMRLSNVKKGANVPSHRPGIVVPPPVFFGEGMREQAKSAQGAQDQRDAPSQELEAQPTPAMAEPRDEVQPSQLPQPRGLIFYVQRETPLCSEVVSDCRDKPELQVKQNGKVVKFQLHQRVEATANHSDGVYPLTVQGMEGFVSGCFLAPEKRTVADDEFDECDRKVKDRLGKSPASNLPSQGGQFSEPSVEQSQGAEERAPEQGGQSPEGGKGAGEDKIWGDE